MVARCRWRSVALVLVLSSGATSDDVWRIIADASESKNGLPSFVSERPSVDVDRTLAAIALGRSGPAGVAALVETARNGSPELASLCVWCMRFSSEAPPESFRTWLADTEDEAVLEAAVDLVTGRPGAEFWGSGILSRGLRSSREATRRKACEAAYLPNEGFRPESVQLLALLSDPSAVVRREAALAVGRSKLPDEALRHELERLLADPHYLVPEAAVLALSDLGLADPRLESQLVVLFLRRKVDAAALAIGRRGRASEQVRTALRSALEDEKFPESRYVAAWALARMGDESFPTARVLARWVSGDKRIRGGDLKFLDRDDAMAVLDGSPILRESLMPMLAGAPSEISVAARALVRVEGVRGTVRPQILALIRNRSGSAQRLIRELRQVRCHTGEVRDVLRAVMRSPPDSIGLEAAESLWHWPEERERVGAFLQEALRTDWADSAERIVARLGSEASWAIPLLTARLSEPGDRRRTVAALEAVGAHRQDVLDSLLALLNDREASVRVVEALGSFTRFADRVGPILREQLSRPTCRVAAAKALARLGRRDEATGKALREGLLHPNEEWAAAAAAALQALGGDLVSAYAQTLPHEVSVAGLRDLGPAARSAADRLCDLIEAEPSNLQALWAVSRIGTDGGKHAVQVMLSRLRAQ